MRNSETLRTALFKQIEGLQNGSVKPDTAKATASCAMAICKTVELDLKARDQLKDEKLKPLNLTGEPEAIEGKSVEIVASDGDKSDVVLTAHKSGLSVDKIASRTGLPIVDVELIIASREAA